MYIYIYIYIYIVYMELLETNYIGTANYLQIKGNILFNVDVEINIRIINYSSDKIEKPHGFHSSTDILFSTDFNKERRLIIRSMNGKT